MTEQTSNTIMDIERKRSFGNNRVVLPDERFDYNIMAQLFFANLRDGDSFELVGENIFVVKVTPEKSFRITLSKTGKTKTVWYQYGTFFGHKGRQIDWFDNYFRNVEGLIVVDLLNSNNPFHKDSIISTIAKRDKIYFS